MDYLTFRNQAKEYPLFRVADLQKWFPRADQRNILNQLNLWTRKGYLERIARGAYRLREYKIKDPFILAGFLYGPSYITLESALNSYGIIPDIPFSTTSAALPKTKVFRTREHGTFFYHHIKPGLFFGFKTVAEGQYAYRIATPEKALFDYLYFRGAGIKNANGFIEELRLSLPRGFNLRNLKAWSGLVSPQKKTFHALIGALLKKHARHAK